MRVYIGTLKTLQFPEIFRFFETTLCTRCVSTEDLYFPYMPSAKIATGVVHTVPADIKKMLQANDDVLELWNGLTPLARNEWICWTTIVKQPETRADHIRQISERLRDGERRPCCWPGCPHRNPKAAKYFR